MDGETVRDLNRFAEALVRISVELESRVSEMDHNEAIGILREVEGLVSDVEVLASEMELFIRKEHHIVNRQV